MKFVLFCFVLPQSWPGLKPLVTMKQPAIYIYASNHALFAKETMRRVVNKAIEVEPQPRSPLLYQHTATRRFLNLVIHRTWSPSVIIRISLSLWTVSCLRMSSITQDTVLSPSARSVRSDQVHFSNHPLPWYSHQIVHGIFGPRATGGGRKFCFSIITNASSRFLVD